MSVLEESCPKRMVYGPCGGVREDLSCEMAPQPCPFAATDDAVPWPGEESPTVATSQLLERARTGPVVLTDLTLTPFDAAGLRHTVGLLRDSCDAVLLGEHQNRPDYPPTLLAALVRDAGGVPWLTLTCRDRNRLVLEQELAGLAVAGADGVFCVTGDGRAQGVRPGVTQVFDLDGTRLTALAAAAGLAVGVPEAPDAAPAALRPARLREKQRAGAQLAVLNHVGSAESLRAFVTAARAAGVTLPIVAGVAVYTDERSAAVLTNFPGLHLDPDAVAEVLAAPDQEAAGIAAAVAEARALLAVPGVVGVNLSGLASSRGIEAATHVKAAVGQQIKELTP